MEGGRRSGRLMSAYSAGSEEVHEPAMPAGEFSFLRERCGGRGGCMLGRACVTRGAAAPADPWLLAGGPACNAWPLGP